jgi:hypothetical protein
MTLRDLNEKQQAELIASCDKNITERNKGRRSENQIVTIDYKMGYSDAVRDLLKRLDYLPDAKS